MKENIQHQGHISRIEGKSVFVTIISHSACASCTIKGVCNTGEMENKIIEVKNAETEKYQIGQQVNIYMAKSLGTKAVFLGYFFPFLVLLISLILLTYFLDSEGLAGLISLLILIPYYFVLYFFREKLGNTFEFRLQS